LFKRLAALSLVCGATACMKTQAVQPQFIPQHKPDKVFITRQDGGFVKVMQPVLLQDTIRGYENKSGTLKRVSLPVSEVQSMQATTTDHLKTLLVLGVPIAAMTGVIVWQVSQQGEPGALTAEPCKITVEVIQANGGNPEQPPQEC
jgi:hypothetical protein